MAIGALAVLLLASCGHQVSRSHTVTQKQAATAAQPITVEPATISVLVDSGMDPAIQAAIQQIGNAYPQLKFQVSSTPDTLASATLLQNHFDLAVLSIKPPPPIESQLDPAYSFSIAPTKVWLTVELPGVTGLVLDAKALSGILSGTVGTWNAAAISSLNPGQNTPPIPVTVSEPATNGVTAYLLEQYLGTVAIPRPATASTNCPTTVGCLDISTSQPATTSANPRQIEISLLDKDQSAQPPTSPDYPLTSSETSMILAPNSEPDKQLGALLLVKYLLNSRHSPQLDSQLQAVTSAIYATDRALLS
jgi:ABC-type phosphate transport system substrate-binding protein